LYVFSRGVARRLAAVLSNVHKLGNGQTMAPALEGRDEISSLDRALHDMAEIIAQKDRENEMFVYSVSHDLRSPLVNLQGFSQELALTCTTLRKVLLEQPLPPAVRDKVLGLLDRDADEAVRFIQTAVGRLAGIIDALLQLSRVGRVEYHKQCVDVNTIVRHVVEALRGTLARQKVEIVIQPLRPAWADPTAVDQLFANLIGNAVNYLDPHRSGKIEVGCTEADLAPQNSIVYYVKDNGMGIAAEFQEKLFLAFQRLHPAAVAGEGIGLALVRRMVERHNGKIWVQSKVGVGSTFYVALPAPPATAGQKQQEVAK